MLHLIWHIIVGFVVGLVARAVMPGAQSMGIILTTLLGIVGGIVDAQVDQRGFAAHRRPLLHLLGQERLRGFDALVALDQLRQRQYR